jgi:hypothetical protein
MLNLRWSAKTFLCVAVVVTFAATACDEFNTPVPPRPSPLPDPRPSSFAITGHWEATSTQGRRIAFDVNSNGRVINGRINLHHECSDGRWRVTFDGFQAQVVDNTFITTVDWEAKDNGVTYAGSYTISGRFEARNIVKGGLLNSVNDIRKKNEQPTGIVCGTVEESYEGNKEQ